MIGGPDFLLVLTFITVLGGVSTLVFRLAMTPAAIRPTLGRRGLRRAEALQRGGLFRLAEPAVRVVAGWIALLSDRADPNSGSPLADSCRRAFGTI